MTGRKIKIFIATSLDGFIAAPGDDLGFLSIVQQEGEDYGYADFIKTVDTVIIGRRTYDWVINQAGPLPYADKTCYVITRSSRPSQGKIQFYTGDIREIVSQIASEPGGDIYADVGSEIIRLLLLHDLIDEMTISVIPVLPGDGIPLFREGRPRQSWSLGEVKKYDRGLVKLTCTREEKQAGD